MEFVLFVCGFFTGFIIRSLFFSSKRSDKKSANMEKTYLRKGLYTQKYQITQLGVKVSEIDVNFEVVEIEKTKNKSKVKVLDMVSSSAEYNNASSQRDKLKSMVENSWIESNEVEWIEDDLSEKREEKVKTFRYINSINKYVYLIHLTAISVDKKKINGKFMALTFFPEQEKLFRERTGKDFSFFYTKYYPKLIYYTSRMCNDPQKAEDISTDSFLIAFEKIDKYEKEKSQFSTWLFTIAKNLMLQDIKNSKKTMSLDVEIDEEGTTMKDFIQEEESEEYLHELTGKKAEIMRRQIATLKEPYRKVIEMREIKKMQYKDIADELDLNLSTVKSQIRNGRSILIKETQKEFEMLDDMYL